MVGRALRELHAPITEAALGRWVYGRLLDDRGLAARAVGSLGDFTGTKQRHEPQRAASTGVVYDGDCGEKPAIRDH